ncbi:metal ABC transporter permease [Halocella sp. SP3-1]|uniref:metal ABC transporter permease n=1 Tax=Halocella sp. SP3-1 TaxID=2382161 RepID=UPI000F75665A|nr:metal ABC transporter permease [Halocella sp. SP3-1]AZO95838.1 metal ABC transporter permease [Halocella sp. SP3-1]
MIKAFMEYTFLQNAVFSALLASIICGIIGTIIIEEKLVMMSGGIAHTSFGGIGLGYFLEIEPIIGALFFSILAAIGLITIRRKIKVNSDTLMGIFWAMGMALGILFIAFTPGYPPDISSYLFGNILTVTSFDIKIILIFTIVLVFTISALFNYWKAYLFDSQFSSVIGIKTKLLEYLLFILIALAIVALIRVVGIILVIALLTAPPAIAKLFSYDLKKMIFYAIFFSMFFSLAGLWISYQFNISSGASIVLLAGFSYFIAVLISKRTAGLKTYS